MHSTKRQLSSLNIRSFERKQWAHWFEIRESRLDGNTDALHRRLERAAHYLHERFRRVHPDWPSGGVEVSVNRGYGTAFIRNMVTIVATWWVFDDVPSDCDDCRATLDGIAAMWKSGRGHAYYELACRCA